ncbi:MAG: extracellular solute-binding protein [Geminicoccaceae bacterium]
MKKYLLATATLAATVGLASDGFAFDWKQFDGKKITVLMNEHPVADGMRTVLDQFTEETGIEVDLQAFAEDLYFDRMELALRSNGGVADVYFLPMDSTAYTQYSAGLIKPLSPYLDDPEMTAEDYDFADFPEGFVSATHYPPGDAGAEHYSIPASFESYILFYNKDHVNEYLDGKVPATMDELLEAAATVKEKSGGSVAGAVMRGIRSDTLIDTVSGIVFNAWGDADIALPQNVWFDNNWEKPRLTDDKIAAGLSHYAGLMAAGPPNILALDWPDASLLFQQGRAAFFIDASLFGPGFEDESASAVAGKTGYAVLPPADAGGPSRTGHWMWGYGIPANAKEPEAGWYFIQWMSSKAIEPSIGKLHGGAGRVSTWANDEYQAALNPEYVDAVLESMKSSRTTVVFREGWSEYALSIVSAIHDIHGGMAPADATAALQAKFEELLAQ